MKKISDITVNFAGDAGLFRVLPEGSSVSDLELVDFNIISTSTSGNAGALAGTLNRCAVSNVLAHNSTNAATVNVFATGNAGGLIGEQIGGEVKYSAAALIVGEKTFGETVIKPVNAGGLIGNASGTITGCYSGGHTEDGSYEKWVNILDQPYDVTGSTAGGLVGISSAVISDSYSTCSVSGTTAGGFAGSAGGSISNCYATGLIDKKNVTTDDDRTTNSSKGAFAGALGVTPSNCKYYSVINEVKKKETIGGETTYSLDHYLGAAGDQVSTAGITPFDLDTDTYKGFVGPWDDTTSGNNWNPAVAYDEKLKEYYGEKYTLETVDELNPTIPQGYSAWNESEIFVMTHYGDWPAPETLIFN